MSPILAVVATLFSVLVPSKTWYAPNQPILVRSDREATLVMRYFDGRPVEPAGDPAIAKDAQVDLRKLFPVSNSPGCYVLLAMPKGVNGEGEFLGTPLVLTVRADRRPDAPPGPMVTKVEPLVYAQFTTEQGEFAVRFYYDVAPNTSASFLDLAAGGYFDGLTFHRVIPGFVIQGGDPRGDGSGSPGYTINPEFSDRPHEAGVLSMARQGDPNEAAGVMPRPEYANSAGSQFFICLDARNTRQLDRRYTAFGKVFSGMGTVDKIAKTPLADPRSGRPMKPPVIQSVKVVPVTAQANPYDIKEKQPAAATAPAVSQ